MVLYFDLISMFEKIHGCGAKVFGWESTPLDFIFDGGLIRFLGNLYKKREKEFGHVYIFLNIKISIYDTESNILMLYRAGLCSRR